MVSYSSSDVISFNDFAYSWRFRGEPWGELTDVQKSEFVSLSKERSRLIAASGRVLRDQNFVTPNLQHYRVVSECAWSANNEDDDVETKKWLSSLPLKPLEKVYISWDAETSAVTTWRTFTEIWDDLCYPFDRVSVFDDTIDWAVLVGPEEHAWYLERSDEQAT